MPEVNARLSEIDALIRAEDPFGRLTGTVYLDAQAAVQWFRLNVFEDVMHLLPIGANFLPRFRLQDAAFKETVGVLARKYLRLPYDDVKAHVRAQSNLLIDGPLEAASPVGKRAVALQQQMFIQAGEDANHNPKRHLGEAETLAMIEELHPGAIFVTADKGAIAVAKDRDIASIARPLAFVGGLMLTRNDVTAFWKHTCFARLCVFSNDWNQVCVEDLECTSLTAEASDRSPVSARLLKASDALKWMRADIEVLITALEAKGD